MHSHPSFACDHAHAHTDQSPQKLRLLWIALGLVIGLAITELIVGYWSHSLALLAESGHMVSDGLAMGLALVAAWITQRLPATKDDRWQHLETIAALLNGIGLVFIALWIGWEAVERLQVPPTEIASMPMLVTAGIGFGINSSIIWLLHRESQTDLNLQGAFLHVLADALSSVGVIVAAIGVAVYHWLWADGVISLLVGGLILFSALPLIWQSWQRLTKTAL